MYEKTRAYSAGLLIHTKGELNLFLVAPLTVVFLLTVNLVFSLFYFHFILMYMTAKKKSVTNKRDAKIKTEKISESKKKKSVEKILNTARPVLSEQKNVSIEEPISWRAAEYEYKKRTLSWHLTVAAVVLGGAVLSFITGNFFFGLFLIGAGILVFFFAKQKPPICEFIISEEMIEIVDKMKIPLDSIKEFSIRSRPGALDELIIRKNVRVNPYVRIQIETKLGEKIRETLSKKIKEVEYEEPIVDIISDYFGF